MGIEVLRHRIVARIQCGDTLKAFRSVTETVNVTFCWFILKLDNINYKEEN